MVFNMKKLYFILFAIMQMYYSANAQEKYQFVFLGNNIGETTMPLNNLINIFKAKNTSWKNNNPIIIVLPSSKSPNADKIANFIYKSNFTSVQKFWLSEVFQGRSKPPVFFDTDEEIIQYVKNNEGAIGVILNNKDLNIPLNLLIKTDNK